MTRRHSCKTLGIVRLENFAKIALVLCLIWGAFTEYGKYRDCAEVDARAEAKQTACKGLE
jgi:hypothetical protein